MRATVPLGLALAATMATAARAADYKVDPKRGHMVVKTEKAGMAARLAHVHYVAARDFSGTLSYDPAAPEKSSVKVDADARKLLADDTAVRKVFGEGPISDGDRKDIQKNMESDDQLDVRKYPKMGFVSTGVSKKGQDLLVKGKLTLHGVTKEVSFPTTVTMEGTALHAKGEIKFNHRDFKIDTYSAAFGAVRNGQPLVLFLDLYADPVAPPPSPAPAAPAGASGPPPAAK